MKGLMNRIMQANLLIWLALGSAAWANPIAVTLTSGDSDGTVRVSITNTSTEDLSVLTWDTPLEGTLSHNVFHIVQTTKPRQLFSRAPYIGRLAKRGAPSSEHFVVIKAGETVSAQVALNRYYSIDEISQWQVTYAGIVRYFPVKSGLQARNKPEAMTVESLPQIALHSNRLPIELRPMASPRLLTPSYNNCSAQQQQDVLAAARAAETITDIAVQDLTSLVGNERAASPRYGTWFGSYSDARFNQVVQNYQLIQQALKQQTISFDCGCNETGLFAYVFINRPYNVFLCPSFRSASLTGADSKAGTIVHELSHFTVLAGTDDHVYSQQGAQSLASSDPARAIDNADNYEYFAENTPNIAIRGTTNTPSTVQHPVLSLGQQVSGSVQQGGGITFQVTGANRIELNSTGGDADLFLYRDAALTAEICRSRNTTNFDVCENFREGTVYVQVFGYSQATFTLRAIGEVNTSTQGIALALNTPVTGTVNQNERVVYTTTGAGIVELVSVVGDADLYIFNSADFTDANLVCSSRLFSSDSLTDSCNLPNSNQTFYVLVVGFSNTSYSLVVSDTINPSIINQGRLTTGVSVSRSINEGSLHNYVVSGAQSVEVTTLSGDADLQIYSNGSYTANSRICVSAEFTSTSAIDRCELPDTGEYYVSVYGYADTQYTIVSIGDIPPDDDPITSGSGSGGGVAHWLMVWFLSGLLLVRAAKLKRDNHA